MRDIVFLALGGAMCTLGRYGLSGWTYRVLGERFPYGTLAVNVVGCLAIGFVMHIGVTTELIPRTVRLAITVGFLGAFTTFSTFGYETLRFIRLLPKLDEIVNEGLITMEKVRVVRYAAGR